ncbi:hypothetical protein PAPYR_8818 [Paratrimastix pyriformis]|uniref:Uncharacterized protein n=1 Tax=Paratrimastix pyriformis TaxID=342808 RepID=A0ABQ8U9R6_9EUKA|nr:hypothetical protein PAPYR_8818 [Paratrimastix pyriformis]
MSRLPFLLPKKLMNATGRYLSHNSYLIRHNFPRPLTYILIANNLNQNKLLRLHNHARSFMTCIFSQMGQFTSIRSIFSNSFIISLIRFLPRLLEDTLSSTLGCSTTAPHSLPQLEIPDNDPS